MAKGICINRLKNGDINNVKVDYGNGMHMDVDVAHYIKKGTLPPCNELPECSDFTEEKDEKI